MNGPWTSGRHQQLRDIAAGLDSVRLLCDFPTAQQKQAAPADAVGSAAPAEASPSPLDALLSSLQTLWKSGEARPTATANRHQNWGGVDQISWSRLPTS